MKLEDIKKLCDEATPGPWRVSGDHWVGGPPEPIQIDADNGWLIADTYSTKNGRIAANAEFIAAARTLLPKVPALMIEVEAYLRVLDQGRDIQPRSALHKLLRKAFDAMQDEP